MCDEDGTAFLPPVICEMGLKTVACSQCGREPNSLTKTCALPPLVSSSCWKWIPSQGPHASPSTPPPSTPPWRTRAHACLHLGINSCGRKGREAEWAGEEVELGCALSQGLGRPQVELKSGKDPAELSSGKARRPGFRGLLRYQLLNAGCPGRGTWPRSCSSVLRKAESCVSSAASIPRGQARSPSFSKEILRRSVQCPL